MIASHVAMAILTHPEFQEQDAVASFNGNNWTAVELAALPLLVLKLGTVIHV